MSRTDSLAWLQENGGPIIRYLLATEPNRGKADLAALKRRLLATGTVRYWLKCLTGRTRFNEIHGSKDTCFENAMGKLSLFGLGPGMGDLDNRCKPYMVWLRKNLKGRKRDIIDGFLCTVVASMLARAGYVRVSMIRETILRRLEVIYTFVKKRDYSIYANRKEFRRIPRAFAHYPIVHPDLYPRGDFALPWIYDILAFRALYTSASDVGTKEKIDAIISYIMQPAYQKLHDGYGVVCTAKNRYNVMGWNVWLPGYCNMHIDDLKMSCFVQRVELLSDFGPVESDRWFNGSVESLQRYATRRGTYVFPKQYIKERRNSYFVTGAHMGLGENRRRKSAYEIESTYWMMRIMKRWKNESKG